MHTSSFFDEFLPKAETYTLDGGQEVTLKKLSYGESQRISNASIKGIDADGNPEIDFEEAQKSKFKKISKALVDPAMTPNQLAALSDDADDLIDELFKIIDPKTWQSIKDAKDKGDEEIEED